MALPHQSEVRSHLLARGKTAATLIGGEHIDNLFATLLLHLKRGVVLCVCITSSAKIALLKLCWISRLLRTQRTRARVLRFCSPCNRSLLVVISFQRARAGG